MKNNFKILTIAGLSIFTLFCSPFVILAQSDSGQTGISVNVTQEFFCNNNGICQPSLGEDEFNCFNDCAVQPQQTGGGGNPYTPPAGLYIQNLKISNVMADSAEISWQTDFYASCATNLGKTLEYGKEISSETETFLSHSLKLIDLEPYTVYHFNIYCKSINGYTAQTGDRFFATPYIVSNVSNFNATVAGQEILLAWENPADPNFRSVRIVRNERFYPADSGDGNIIYEGTGLTFTDKNIQAGKTYYYAIFAKDKNNNWSQGVLAFARIKPAVLPITPEVSTNKEVTITIFNFSLPEANLPVGEDGVIDVSPNDPLTISANCAKIPGAKKIIVTLKNEGENFSPISKTESDGDSCGILLISPENPGTYLIEISITDSSNRVIAKIEAKLKVAGKGQPVWVLEIIFTAMYIFLVVIIILVFWKIKRKQPSK